MDNQPNKNPELESFLDKLSRSLGTISAQLRSQEIDEMRSHIEQSASSNISEGIDPVSAYNKAISQMGDSTDLGAKLSKEWQLRVKSTQRRLIRGVFGAAFIGAITSLMIFLDWSWIVQSILPNHQINSRAVSLIGFSNILYMCVPVAIGLYLAKLMPHDSSPSAVIPSAIYTGLLLCVLRFGLLLVRDWSLHLHEVVQFGAGTMFVVFLCLSANASRAVSLYRLTRTAGESWKLRID